MGSCDVSDVCTGLSDVCPPDELVQALTVCKPLKENEDAKAESAPVDAAVIDYVQSRYSHILGMVSFR